MPTGDAPTPPGWDSRHPGRAPALDRRGRRRRRAPTDEAEQAWDDSDAGRSATRGYVDDGAFEVARNSRATGPRSLTASRAGLTPRSPSSPARRCRGSARRCRRDVDGDRAVHGDLAHALDVYDARTASSSRHRPDQASRTSVSDSATSPTRCHEENAAGRGVRGHAGRPSGATSGPGDPRTPPRSVSGPAYDCLLVTQRRQAATTDLHGAVGADADSGWAWAQAFAGRPAPAARRRRAVIRRPTAPVCSTATGSQRMREMLRRRRGRRAHRRLPGRADHADRRQGRPPGTRRSATRAPSSAISRTASALRSKRGVRIVSNAGGLNPGRPGRQVREVARGLGLDPVIAHVEGDKPRPAAAGARPGRRADRQRSDFGERSASLTPTIARLVDGDAVNPGFQVGIAPKMTNALKRAQESFLC